MTPHRKVEIELRHYLSWLDIMGLEETHEMMWDIHIFLNYEVSRKTHEYRESLAEMNIQHTKQLIKYND